MDSHRWQRVEQVFFAVLDRPLDERAEAIAEICADDPQLLAEVERLLAADRTMASDGFLAAVPRTMPVAGGAIGDTHARGMRIGRYVVDRTIGEGGMGTVLLASRAEDFEQQVAIEVLHRGLHVEAFAARFRDELRILAALAKHPNIASLYDAGTCEDGRPYFVMEYIAGQRIDRYCDARQLTTRQRIELFRQVCAAVEFAHRHTVIHRDLKPSNILVDEQGTPKLIDFGIAKIVGDGLGDLSTSETRQVTEHLALAPDYASPEQFRGDDDGYRRACIRLLAAAAARDDAATTCVWPIVFAADAGVDYEACVAAARRALADSAKKPSHAAGRQRAFLGAALLRSGELEQASEQLNLALSQWPQSATQRPHSPTKADALRLAALVASRQNRPREAATFATQAAAAEQTEQATAQLDRGACARFPLTSAANAKHATSPSPIEASFSRTWTERRRPAALRRSAS